MDESILFYLKKSGKAYVDHLVKEQGNWYAEVTNGVMKINTYSLYGGKMTYNRLSSLLKRDFDISLPDERTLRLQRTSGNRLYYA